MNKNLPDYYFRARENGAQVFHISSDDRRQRLDMSPIATINIRNGEVKPQGGHELTEMDRKAIDDWIAERRALLAQREVDDILRTVDRLNLATQWVQSKANDEQIAQFDTDLLMAMHDLRTVLVRRQADRLAHEAKLDRKREA